MSVISLENILPMRFTSTAHTHTHTHTRLSFPSVHDVRAEAPLCPVASQIIKYTSIIADQYTSGCKEDRP